MCVQLPLGDDQSPQGPQPNFWGMIAPLLMSNMMAQLPPCIVVGGKSSIILLHLILSYVKTAFYTF
jgi:hypothetical protein